MFGGQKENQHFALARDILSFLFRSHSPPILPLPQTPILTSHPTLALALPPQALSTHHRFLLPTTPHTPPRVLPSSQSHHTTPFSTLRCDRSTILGRHDAYSACVWRATHRKWAACQICGAIHYRLRMPRLCSVLTTLCRTDANGCICGQDMQPFASIYARTYAPARCFI